MYSDYLITKLPTMDLHAAVQMLANKKWVALTTDKATNEHYLCKANFYLWGSENKISRGVNVEIVNGGGIAEFRIKTYNKRAFKGESRCGSEHRRILMCRT